jgi:exodeoxyribonuclease VII large subunit
LVIYSRQDVDEQLEALHQRLGKAVRYRLLMARQNLTELAQHAAFGRMMDLIHRREQRADELLNRLAHAQRDILEKQRRRFETLSAAVRHYDVRRVLSGMKKDLDAWFTALISATRNSLFERKVRLQRMDTALQALSPLSILDRGYALVFDASGKILKDASRVKAGDQISARLAKGTIDAVAKKRGS